MARLKYDGVLEAVRYRPDGRIEVARIYERRGSAFSDRILLTRQQLIDRIRTGQKIVVGQRQLFLAGTFETGPAVSLAGPKDDPLLSASAQKDAEQDNQRDHLQNVPVF